MATYNRTKYELSYILHLPLLKRGRNNWRQRYISLYEHPTDPTRVVSVGVTFDGNERIICDELLTDWQRELNQKGNFVTE